MEGEPQGRMGIGQGGDGMTGNNRNSAEFEHSGAKHNDRFCALDSGKGPRGLFRYQRCRD